MIFAKVSTPNPLNAKTLRDPEFAGVSACLANPSLLVGPSDLVPPPVFGSDAFWREWLEVCRFVSYAKGWTSQPPQAATALQITPACVYTISPLIEAYLSERHHSDQKAQTRSAQLAAAVRADHPTELGRLILAWLQKQGATPRLSLVGNVGGDRRFAHTLLCTAVIAEAVTITHPNAFAAKWTYLRPRPEEVAAAVAKGEVSAPAHILAHATQLLDWAEIETDATAFTTYANEGAPLHPSYPAMHGAAAGLSLLFSLLFELSADQQSAVRGAAADWAYGRTFAGVHYRSDNDAGLWLGEEVMSLWLPERLHHANLSTQAIAELCQDARTPWLPAQQSAGLT